MGRKRGTPTICSVCGDKSTGINFNASSCNSCKAFFRRTAPQNKVTPCPFTGNCLINKVTRKFCSACRLAQCFRVGMKKEWIYTEEERAFLKERIELNKRKRRQCNRNGAENQEAVEPPQMSSSNSSCTTATADAAVVDLLDFNFQNIAISSGVNETVVQFQSNEGYPFSCSSEADSTTTSNSASDSVDLFLQSLITDSSTSSTFNEQPPPPPLSPPLQLDASLENVCDQILQQPDVMSQIDLSQIDFSGLEEENEPSENFVASLIEHKKEPENNTGNHFLLLDFEPPVFQALSIYYPSFLGLPTGHQLSTSEEYLLQELSTACRLLQNPYKRIQYFESLSPHSSTRIIEYTFYRINRCCKQISAFTALSRTVQSKLLQCSLLKIFCLRMVLYFNERRAAWNLIDDFNQSGMLVRFEYLIPSCPNEEHIKRHRRLSSLFDEEWKEDPIIFDLLTAVLLFMPGSSDGGDQMIRNEHNRYLLLLQKYLTIKYPNVNEASETFNRLLVAVNELLQLNPDIVNFFRRYMARYGAYVNQEFYRQLTESCGNSAVVETISAPLENNFRDQMVISEMDNGGLDSIFDSCWM